MTQHRDADDSDGGLTNDSSQMWLAARRLTSAFGSGSADNVLEVMQEIDAADGWMAVAIALNGDVVSLAHQVHGTNTQRWLDHRIAKMLDRRSMRASNE